MKKMLTVLTTVILGSNTGLTGLLVSKTTNQSQRWAGTESKRVSAQVISKKQNLVADNSKQLTAGFIRSIITMINHNVELNNFEITVKNIEGSEGTVKNEIRDKFMFILKNYGIDFNHLVFDFEFTDFAPPQ